MHKDPDASGLRRKLMMNHTMYDEMGKACSIGGRTLSTVEDLNVILILIVGDIANALET